MKNHSWANARLYEFVNNELTQDDRRKIEAHLAHCDECKNDVETVRIVLHELDATSTDWSAKHSEDYWNSFASSVQEKITQEKNHIHLFDRLTEWIDSIILFKPKEIALASSVCAILLIVLVAGKDFAFRATEHTSPSQEYGSHHTPAIDSEYLQLHDYFRKSRTLLVGLANLKTEEGEDVDLQTERNKSRMLLHEARKLKQHQLDSRSERLINDMEKIFIKVANSAEEQNSPELQLIRGGIERENLLYKIRRAEAMYQQPQILFASNRE